MKISLKDAKEVADKLEVDLNVVDLHTLRDGMEVEMEHGSVRYRTNVTNNDLIKTAKIALAHINEYPDYYERLEKMEKKARKYWLKRTKPYIYLY